MSSRLAAEPVLREAAPADAAFLRALYASTREDELALVPWRGEQREAFLDLQFDLRESSWRTARPASVSSVVEVDGERVGRLDVDRSGAAIHVVDLALLAGHRGRGIGGALLRAVLEEADAAGRAVTIYVEQGNPARRLYERLGFRAVDSTGVYDLLERRPA